MNNETLMSSLTQMISIEDRDIVNSESKVLFVHCLGKGCDLKGFTIVQEFRVKSATCPFCNQNHSIRCFKNGSIKITAK